MAGWSVERALTEKVREYMLIHHKIKQNTEDWEQLRIGKLTSSNFGVVMANENKQIFGDPAKRLALRIALERLTGKKSEEYFSNSHMERGHAQEPCARLLYEDQFFVSVENGGFFEQGSIGCSPDGLVGDDGLIEIKSVIPSTHYATMKRGSYDPCYTWQLVGNISITNREWIDFISYCSEFPEDKQLLVFRTYRIDFIDKIDRLRARREEFLKLIDNILVDLL